MNDIEYIFMFCFFYLSYQQYNILCILIFKISLLFCQKNILTILSLRIFKKYLQM